MINSRDFWRQFLVLLLAGTVLLTLAFYITYRIQRDILLTQATEGQQTRAQALRGLVHDAFGDVGRDMLLLRDNPALAAFLASESGQTRQRVQRFFDSFLRHSPHYFQVRLIGTNGIEKVRSARTRSAPDVLEHGPLQDKSAREYFTQALALPAGSLYISRLDLNSERGMLERPIRPTMRFSLPVFHAGQLHGVLVLNLEAQHLVDGLKHATAGHARLWLANKAGQVLLAPNPIYDWSNVFQDAQQADLAGLLPLLPADLQQPGDTLTRRVQDVLLSSIWISPSTMIHSADGLEFTPGPDEPWHVVLESSPTDGLTGGVLIRKLTRLYMFGLTLLVLVILYHTAVSQRGEEQGRALRRTQKLIKALFNNSPAAIFVKDKAGRFIEVNTVFEQLLQRPAEQIVGQQTCAVYPEPMCRDIAAYDRRILDNGESISVEEQIGRPDSDACVTLQSVRFPLRDADNDIIGLGGISLDISDLKASVREANEARRMFHTLFNQNRHSLAVLDASGRVVEVNDRMLFAMEHDRDAVVGQPFNDIDWWPDSAALRPRLADLLRETVDRGHVKCELELCDRHGQPQIVDLSIHVVRDTDGQIGHMLVEGRDVTDQVAAQRELRANNTIMSALSYAQSAFIRNTSANELFAHLLEDAVKLADSEHGFIGEVLRRPDGRSYMRPYAMSDTAWQGPPPSPCPDNAYNGLEFDNLDSLIGEVIRSGVVVISNAVAQDPRSGGVPPGHPDLDNFLGIPIYHGDKLVGIVGLANRAGGYSDDVAQFLTPLISTCGSIINGYRTAEAEQQARQALRLSEQRFRDVLEGAPDAIMIINTQGTIEMVNTQAKQMFGYESEELLGQPVELLVPPEYAKNHDAHRRSFMEGEDVRRQMAPGARELTALRKDGTRIPVDITLASHHRDDGLNVICSIRDISDKKKFEEHLRQRQKLESIGQLTGGIAHDFNNLLGVIIGNADLALEVDDTVERMRLRVQGIIDTAEKGAVLTRRLLAFSRNQPLNSEPTQVNDVLQELHAVLPRTLGADINIDTHQADDLWPVLIDRNELESALLNLAINARDAMPQGGQLGFQTENLSLDGESQDQDFDEPVIPGDYVCISVTDTGCGIAEDDLTRVFEPFFTTKAIGAGTGLGLAMVFGFVKQSQGYIKPYSEVGIGTTIRILLPRHHDSATTRAGTGDSAPEEPPAGSETVLLVDDEPEMLSYAANSLRKAGYTVLEADSGDEAFPMLQEHDDISLLISDIVMPGELNGIALGKKSIAARPDLKIIFVSGFPKAMLEAKGELDFPYRLLGKPYRGAALVKTAREVLDAT